MVKQKPLSMKLNKKVNEMSKDMNYSKAVQRLEEIVQTLERDGIPLDETLKLYEEGAELLEFVNRN